MRRSHVNNRRDKKIFSKTADNVHSVNFTYLAPQRGGRRM